jgi:hypothetical protein
LLLDEFHLAKASILALARATTGSRTASVSLAKCAKSHTDDTESVPKKEAIWKKQRGPSNAL